MYKKLLIACSIRQSNCHNLSDFNLPYLVADKRKGFFISWTFFLIWIQLFLFFAIYSRATLKIPFIKKFVSTYVQECQNNLTTLFIITYLKYLSNKGYFYLFKGRIKSSSTNFQSIIIFISNNFDIHSV